MRYNRKKGSDKILMNKIDIELAKNSNNIKLAELAKFCAKYEKIFLYGAGDICREILKLLKRIGIHPEAIIVSKGHKEYDNLEEIPIFEIDELEIQENVGIVVSTAPYTEGIDISLMEKGICNSNIYIQNFYDNYLFNRKSTNERSRNCGFFSKYSKLDDLGIKYGTDKSSVSLNYLNKYDFFLKKFQNEKITLLELGVNKGSSIMMWKEYFCKAEIVGVDINEECKECEDTVRGIKIVIGDLGDSDFIKKLTEFCPTIVVDDASHCWSHQIKALCYLFPELVSGGIYILEDTVTSFSMFEGHGFDDMSFSAYDFCECIAMIVSSGEPARHDNIRVEAMRAFIPKIEKLARDIEMISFIHGSCILVKR